MKKEFNSLKYFDLTYRLILFTIIHNNYFFLLFYLYMNDIYIYILK